MRVSDAVFQKVTYPHVTPAWSPPVCACALAWLFRSRDGLWRTGGRVRGAVGGRTDARLALANLNLEPETLNLDRSSTCIGLYCCWNTAHCLSKLLPSPMLTRFRVLGFRVQGLVFIV